MKTFLRTRIERYVDSMPEAVSGSHGHSATFKVAVALVRGFHLNPSDAMPFMHRYNHRCDPPWSDKELKHKLDSADKLNARSGKVRGYLL
jgi:hypothetical protein